MTTATTPPANSPSATSKPPAVSPTYPQHDFAANAAWLILRRPSPQPLPL